MNGDPRRYELRPDLDEFRAFLARGTVEKSGRCVLPDGTTRGVHSTVTFRPGLAYRCVEAWIRVTYPPSPVRQPFERRVVIERQVKWQAFYSIVPLDWQGPL